LNRGLIDSCEPLSSHSLVLFALTFSFYFNMQTPLLELSVGVSQDIKHWSSSVLDLSESAFVCARESSLSIVHFWSIS